MNSIPPCVATFIIHFSPLAQRLQFQINTFTWNVLSPKVITEATLNDSIPALHVFRNLDAHVKAEIWAQTSQIQHILQHHTDSLSRNIFEITPAPEFFSRTHFTPYEIYPFYSQAISAYSKKNHDLSLQHMNAILAFLDSSLDYCLILEDDSIPLLSDHSAFRITIDSCLQAIETLGEGYFDLSDSLSLSASDNSPTELDPSFSLMSSGQTRCSSAYLLTRNVAKSLISSYFPLVLPVDWHLSYLLSSFAIPTYWYSHPIFTQGSQTGHFDSNQKLRNS
tara:strand:+ start:6870 stop:7706 length:837 start_codon:yes stop_codon:yes gene_type:complete